MSFIKCIVCGTNEPLGEKWIVVAGGHYVCSTECEVKRLNKIARFINNHFVFNKNTIK